MRSLPPDRSVRRLSLWVLAAGVSMGLISVNAFAASQRQAHFRFGYLSTSLSGPETSGSFSVPNTLDFDLELFEGTRRAWVFKATFAHDTGTSRTVYNGTGLGHRFYLGPVGTPYEQADGAQIVRSIPTWRYYVGAEAMVSRVLVRSLGSVLEVGSSLIESAASAGAIYQVGRSLGVEAHLGYGIGFGFSSVSVSASTLRAFLGFTYAF